MKDMMADDTLAVLRAIRNPDERVLEAMAAALVRPTVMMGGTSPLARRQALAVWQAGIDAIAVKGEKNES